MAYINLELRLHLPNQPFLPHQTSEWVAMKAHDLLAQYFQLNHPEAEVDVILTSPIKECDTACSPLHPTKCATCGTVSRVRYRPRCPNCNTERV